MDRGESVPATAAAWAASPAVMIVTFLSIISPFVIPSVIMVIER